VPKIGCKSSNKFFICRHETDREKLSDILKHAKNILETREIPLRKERKKKDLSFYTLFQVLIKETPVA
jgi:hypothetical protein